MACLWTVTDGPNIAGRCWDEVLRKRRKRSSRKELSWLGRRKGRWDFHQISQSALHMSLMPGSRSFWINRETAFPLTAINNPMRRFESLWCGKVGYYHWCGRELAKTIIAVHTLAIWISWLYTVTPMHIILTSYQISSAPVTNWKMRWTWLVTLWLNINIGWHYGHLYLPISGIVGFD